MRGFPWRVVTGDYLVDDAVSDELQRLGSRLYFKPLWDEDVVQIVANLLESHSVAASDVP